jgi:hypothetical protein
MIVRSGDLSIANLCNDLRAKRIRVNHDYQRLPKAWSNAARSYLVETILKGYPVPKIYLWQTTDLKTKKTEMEIVDGQQRVTAILAFADDQLKITSKGDYTGKSFSALDEEDQLRFLDYFLGTDTLSGATKKQVREVYRRINSYTTPLNAQEKRFAASYGGVGSIKYFIIDLADEFSDYLATAGTFSENKIGRMADQEWFAKVIDQLRLGIHTSNPKKLDMLYIAFDDEQFPFATETTLRCNEFFGWLSRNTEFHNSNVSSPEQLLSLAVAFMHLVCPAPDLTAAGVLGGELDDDISISRRLSELNSALDLDPDEMSERDPLRPFVMAGTEATNTVKNRTTRINAYLEALRRK